MDNAFWTVKLLESINVLNCPVKVSAADLYKIGLKMRESHFRELSSLSSRKGGAMSCNPPPTAPKKVQLWCIF